MRAGRRAPPASEWTKRGVSSGPGAGCHRSSSDHLRACFCAGVPGRRWPRQVFDRSALLLTILTCKRRGAPRSRNRTEGPAVPAALTRPCSGRQPYCAAGSRSIQHAGHSYLLHFHLGMVWHDCQIQGQFSARNRVPIPYLPRVPMTVPAVAAPQIYRHPVCISSVCAPVSSAAI